MKIKQLQEELIKYNPEAEILFCVKGKDIDLCLVEGDNCDIRFLPSLGRIVGADEVEPSLFITADKTEYEFDEDGE